MIILCCRAHVTMHQHTCGKKAAKCIVPGCTRIFIKQDMEAHQFNAATSHSALQFGEIQRLKALINEKVQKSKFFLFFAYTNILGMLEKCNNCMLV